MLVQIATIVMSVIAVILGIFIVTKYQKWFINHRLKLITTFLVLGIAIYTYGYLTKHPKDYLFAGLMAIFSSGRMLVFENDLSSFEAEVAGYPLYNLLFATIMTLSMLTTAMIVLSFFGNRAISSIQLSFLKLIPNKRNFYIFSQLNRKALCLADDLKKKNRKNKIIFCRRANHEIVEDNVLEQEAADRGFLIKTVNQTEEATVFHLYKGHCRNKIHVICIDEDDMKNISFVEEFAKQIQKWKSRKRHKRTLQELPIYALIKNKDYEELFHEELLIGIDLHMIDEADLASRQLFHKFNLMSCLGNKDTLTVCVVGYNEITENLYKDINYLGQSKGVKLKLLMVDEEIKQKTAVFFHQNPELQKCVALDFVDLKLNTTDFFEYFQNNLEDINCVIISNENIATAREVSRINSYNSYTARICMYVKHYDVYRPVIQAGLLKDCITFGAMKDIFTEEIIIQEKLDELAKGFHGYYAGLYHDTRSWNQISYFERQSNRALALSVQTKLHSLGLKYEEGHDIRLYEEKLRDKELLETLAQSEHMRWNAYHYTNGWRTLKESNNREKKIALNKTHSCLVDWEELDKVSAEFKYDYKEMDRHLIRNIGNVLQSAGLGVIPK